MERYSITQSADAIRQRFSVDVPDFYRPRYNAAPTQLLPVITASDSSGLSLFYWGKPPEWAKNKNLSDKIISLKSDLLLERPVLKKMLMKNRCIIPADGFYTWKRLGAKIKIPMRYVLEDDASFSFAGVWEEFESESGERVHTFMIITRPVAGKEPDKPEYTPLILERSLEKIWLSQSIDDATLKKVIEEPEPPFRSYSVSPRIQSQEADHPSLIQPVPPADQFGNLTLFD